MTRNRRAVVKVVLLSLTAALLTVGPRSGSAAGAPLDGGVGQKPTIVLVHGAWADSSSWNAVVQRLTDHGYPSIAPANPLRGLQYEAAYLSSVLATISGPIVLVGHSYGGMVMTNAAVGHPNVRALVYIAASAPDAGDTVATIEVMNPGSELGLKTLTLRPYPGGVDTYITPSVFHGVFCADVPSDTAALMAATQRPLEAAVEAEPSGPPAWRAIPSWYLVAGDDNATRPPRNASWPGGPALPSWSWPRRTSR